MTAVKKIEVELVESQAKTLLKQQGEISFRLLPSGSSSLVSPKEGDQYETVKEKLFNLLDHIDETTCIYHPLQKEQLRASIKDIVKSLNKNYGSKIKFLGKTIEMPNYAGYRNQDHQKAEMLTKIFNAIVDPYHHAKSLRDHVNKQKKFYPSLHPYFLRFIAGIEFVVGLVGIMASLVGMMFTGGLAGFGLIPSISIYFHSIFTWEKANLAKEKTQLIEFSQFFDDDVYSNAKKQLFYSLGCSTFNPNANIQDKKEELLTEESKAQAQAIEALQISNVPELITNFIRELDESHLSSDEKVNIVTNVNNMVTDPLNHAEQFTNFVANMKAKYPSTSEHSRMIQAFCMTGAILIGVLSLAFAWSGFSLLGLPVAFALGKYGLYQSKKEKTAMAIESLENINAETTKITTPIKQKT